MEVVSEGSLESISRPASTASDTGRSISSASRLSKISSSKVSGSLEMLPPEASALPGELFSALEMDVEVEDFEDDFDEDSCVDSESSLTEDDAADNLGPEECSETSRVSTSRVSEASDHHSNSSDSKMSADEVPQLTSEEDNVDPKIREGLEKIKKLDKILGEKVKKEKEVKSQRHMNEKMWKEQLMQIAKCPESGKDNPFVGAAIRAIELGNEEDLGSSRVGSVTPVFATQPLNTEELHSTRHCDSATSGRTTECSSQSNAFSEKSKTRRHRKGSNKKHDGSHTESAKNASKMATKSKQKGQDFIKRNKQLAADAANVIPMTEEEKSRLEQLLRDDNTDSLVNENPFDSSTLSLTSGVGFRPDEVSAQALAEIEEKLQALVPSDELELTSRALIYTPLSQSSDSEHSTHSKVQGDIDHIDTVDIGEKVLREEKDSREMHQRLQLIEQELQKLKLLSEDETEDKISQELLRKLLCESSRTTSRSTTVGQAVVSSLSNPRYPAIQEGGLISEDVTPRPLSSLSGLTESERSGDREGTPSTLRTVSTMSDVTLTSVTETPRTDT
ncbi:fibrous sheath-interacting protein 1 [Nematostella vectensis]|uniref:fibrous sheath-interacting protein 1 n=1 Tax=Nematostella vectensis TaxID=45351 RepID=UPI002076E0D0|nr:fibrous sheath-interacting protein 1 [Nematostella vectensis]